MYCRDPAHHYHQCKLMEQHNKAWDHHSDQRLEAIKEVEERERSGGERLVEKLGGGKVKEEYKMEMEKDPHWKNLYAMDSHPPRTGLRKQEG